MNISTLRKALGPSEHQYIETIPKLGYRFVSSVHELLDESSRLVVEKSARALIIVAEEEEGNRQEAIRSPLCHRSVSSDLTACY